MTSNVFMEEGKHLVGKTRVGGSLKESIRHAVDLIGGFEKTIQSGDHVTIKPNMNTADPYPASSASDFIKALGELILDAGAEKLRIVESSTILVSARGVAEKIGMLEVAEGLGLRIPADLSLVGYDDISYASLPRIQLTTVAQPAVEMGQIAANWLFEALEHPGIASLHQTLIPRLVVRSMSGSLKGPSPTTVSSSPTPTPID